jgi:NifU-like protein involved in Fe-S cluster formation
VLARVRDPRRVGWLPRDAPDVGTGEAGTIESGTMARIQVRVEPASGRIALAVFRVFGCSAAIASASLVTERMEGASVEDAAGIEPLAVVAELELPAERARIAALVVEAARGAIEDWKRKHD